MSMTPEQQKAVDLREQLGRKVREIWIAWAKEQPVGKPSWLVPWHLLTEPEREVDRRIGEAIYAQTQSALEQAQAQLHQFQHHSLLCPRCAQPFHESDTQESSANYWRCPFCFTWQHSKCRWPLEPDHEVQALQAKLFASEAAAAEMRAVIQVYEKAYGFDDSTMLQKALSTTCGTAFLAERERHISLLRRTRTLLCDARAEVAARTNANAEPGCTSAQWIIGGDLRDDIDEALKETK